MISRSGLVHSHETILSSKSLGGFPLLNNPILSLCLSDIFVSEIGLLGGIPSDNAMSYAVCVVV